MQINPALHEIYKGRKGHETLCELLEAHQEASGNESAQSVRIRSEAIPTLQKEWEDAFGNYQRLKKIYHEREAKYKKEEAERYAAYMQETKKYLSNPSFDAQAPEAYETWGELHQLHYDHQIELWEQVMHYDLLRKDYEIHYIHEDMKHLL